MRAEATVEVVAGLDEQVHEALQRARTCLLERQAPQGYWAGDLRADVSVGAGYVPLLYFLTGRLPTDRLSKIVNHLRLAQKPDGSWPSYGGGPGDLNVSVQTYFAAKLAGISAEEPWLRKAREFIRNHGGLSRINAITKIWLALFGQVGWSRVPSVPPALMLLPTWFPVNLYEFSSWSRATIVALMALTARKPVCPVPERASLSDLAIDSASGREHLQSSRPFSAERFFFVLDRLLKALDRLPIKPGRGQALKRVERWILKHQESDGSWGGILLPWVYSLMALKSLGYSADHPVIVKGIRGLDEFFVEEGDGLWLQPATSPVWDTAWTVIALRESGLPADDPALVQAARWLLSRQIRTPGDWSVKNPRTDPGCWSFEFQNTMYPDLDDTAVVPRALLRVRLEGSEESGRNEAVARAARWVQQMQSADGGWAAFDRDNTRRILAHVPFADFITPLDPTCADVTAHVIEFLGEDGAHKESLARATRYLARTQEADGAWYGRWGVNYIYGTGLALAALASRREGHFLASMSRAIDWLLAHQNADGGWGEGCVTYEDPSTRGRGPSTASQTAWALLGLIAATSHHDLVNRNRVERAIDDGVRYLTASQRVEGDWEEKSWTGTGFPRAFYLRYDLYRLYFALLALSLFVRNRRASQTAEERFAAIDPSQRILLVSHCLRRTEMCTATYGAWGLECRDCGAECAIHRLTKRAEELGYKGSCAAAGGRMALKFVQDMRPQGIVAVACSKELSEGIDAVQKVSQGSDEAPVILIVPLTKEGCHDTEVDIEQALRILNLGTTRSPA